MSLEGATYRIVSLYIKGLSYFHKIRGITDNTRSFIVSKALEGFRRTHGLEPDTRAPLTLQILKKLITALPSVCYSYYEAELFAAIFATTYFGLLRVSEVINLGVKNCKLESHTLKLVLEKSKTDQYGHSTTLALEKQVDDLICPLHLVRQYLQLRPSEPVHALFIHTNGKPVTRYQFNFILQKALTFLGIEGHYRPHSFRIGRATELARHGATDAHIKTMGRWRSGVFSRYIRTEHF
jgi:integrase